MNIIIGADHRGSEAATRLAEKLRTLSHHVELVVPQQGQAADYPDPAYVVGQAVSDGRMEIGVLIDGSGVGMCMAANKVKGVRAAPVHDEVTAEVSRAHIDANVICLSADLLGLRLMEKIIDLFLKTTFQGGRHARRLEKIRAIEEGQDPRGLAPPGSMFESTG
ncbi:MAG TPA: RpiB/LacA/LacB family sugar-phosphate isomerase [Phycisphaerales bacterium]|nr:RpiB/LacA/LacB family sugar-phosphate isomerase [Phycisphaerales bacterium]